MQHRNSLLRLANSTAPRGNTLLQVISVERAEGQQPLGEKPAVQPNGPYPATASDLRDLAHVQLDQLAEFYGEDFGQVADGSLQRQRMFALFVGFPQP